MWTVPDAVMTFPIGVVSMLAGLAGCRTESVWHHAKLDIRQVAAKNTPANTPTERAVMAPSISVRGTLNSSLITRFCTQFNAFHAIFRVNLNNPNLRGYSTRACCLGLRRAQTGLVGLAAGNSGGR